jgi:hypothetical protein
VEKEWKHAGVGYLLKFRLLQKVLSADATRIKTGCNDTFFNLIIPSKNM